MKSFKLLMSSQDLVIFKAFALIFIIWSGYSYIHGEEFSLLGRALMLLGFAMISFFFLVIVSSLSFNRKRLEPLFSESVVLRESEALFSKLKIVDEYPGIFLVTSTEEFKRTNQLMKPVPNPTELYYKMLNSYKILDSIGSMRADETKAKMEPFISRLFEMVEDNKVTEDEPIALKKSSITYNMQSLVHKDNSPSTRRIGWSVFVLLIVCIASFGLFVYPGMYHYDKYKNFPIKVNRFTGETEIFRTNGWQKVPDSE